MKTTESTVGSRRVQSGGLLGLGVFVVLCFFLDCIMGYSWLLWAYGDCMGYYEFMVPSSTGCLFQMG